MTLLTDHDHEMIATARNRAHVVVAFPPDRQIVAILVAWRPRRSHKNRGARSRSNTARIEFASGSRMSVPVDRIVGLADPRDVAAFYKAQEVTL